MDELVNDMRKRGLIFFDSELGIKPILNLILILSITEPIEIDPDWWELRLYLVRN